MRERERGRGSDRDRSDRDRMGRRLVGAVFALLPALMALGLLAPNWIEARLVAAQAAPVPEAPSPLSWQPHHFKRPLLLPSEMLVDSDLDLVGVSALLERVTQALGGELAEEANPTSFAEYVAFPEDEVELTEEDRRELVEEEIFQNMLEPALTVDLSPVWPEFADIIEWDAQGLGAGYSLFVDFAGDESSGTGVAVPVPEPGTAGLLAVGLCALGGRRRRSR